MSTYLAMSPNHYGKGSSPEEAKANLKRFGGTLKQHIVYLMPEGSSEHQVDDLGSLRWKWDADADRTSEAVVISHRGL